MIIDVVLDSVDMEHTIDREAASKAAIGVRAFMASYGITDCEILPAGDRVVIHLPTAEATDLVMAAHTHGKVLRYPDPNQLPLFNEEFQPTYAVG